MKRLPRSLAWMLAFWAFVMPTLAAAHDLEHSFEDETHEPILCACAAFHDRDDDVPLEPLAVVLAPSEPTSEPLDLEADDRVALNLRATQAIRAPPAA